MDAAYMCSRTPTLSQVVKTEVLNRLNIDTSIVSIIIVKSCQQIMKTPKLGYFSLSGGELPLKDVISPHSSQDWYLLKANRLLQAPSQLVVSHSTRCLVHAAECSSVHFPGIIYIIIQNQCMLH